MRQKVEVLIEFRHYEVSVIEEILAISEEDYSSLDVHSIKVGVCSSPACAELGEVFFLSSILIHESIARQVLVGMLANSMYDLFKFMEEKIPVLLRSCKYTVQDVPVGCDVDIKYSEDANIRLNLSFSSCELQEISGGLEQLKETFDTIDLEGDVKISYKDSKWRISN